MYRIGTQARSGLGNVFMPVDMLQSHKLKLVWRVSYTVADGTFTPKRPQWHLRSSIALKKDEAVVLFGSWAATESA